MCISLQYNLMHTLLLTNLVHLLLALIKCLDTWGSLWPLVDWGTHGSIVDGQALWCHWLMMCDDRTTSHCRISLLSSAWTSCLKMTSWRSLVLVRSSDSWASRSRLPRFSQAPRVNWCRSRTPFEASRWFLMVSLICGVSGSWETSRNKSRNLQLDAEKY